MNNWTRSVLRKVPSMGWGGRTSGTSGTSGAAGRVGFGALKVGLGALAAGVYLSQLRWDPAALQDKAPPQPPPEDMLIKVVDTFIDVPVQTVGSPAKVLVQVKELGNEEYPLLVSQPDSRHVGCTGAVCTYDHKTDLSKGLLVNNKIICPEHGCEYNAFTGEVEYGPAVNGLPAFHVEYGTLDGQPKLKITLPHLMPRAVAPMMGGSNPDDYRKVLIVGCGGGAMGCAETLRKTAFTGEITVFCSSKYGPIQRRNLTKFSRLRGNEVQIMYRTPEFFKDYAINILSGTKVDKILIGDENGGVKTSDGGKYYYDALVIASGLKPPEFEPTYEVGNYVDLNKLEDFLKAEKLLQSGRTVAINGITPQSLELASTLLRERPGIKVHLFSGLMNKRTGKVFGTDAYKAILAGLRKQGVKVYPTSVQVQMVVNEKSQKVQDLLIFGQEGELPSVAPDVFYDFAGLLIGNTKILSTKKFGDLVLKNNWGQIEVNPEQRTPIQFIFAAGGASSPTDFSTKEDLREPSFSDAYHQGEIAAYNINALRVANHRPTFQYYSILGENIQVLGEKPNRVDEVWTEGDPAKLDFITYYANEGKVKAVVATSKYQREMMMLKEGIHGGAGADLERLKKDRNEFYQSLLRHLTSDSSFCTYREKVFSRHDQPFLKDIFWQEKSRSLQTATEDFVNFKTAVDNIKA